MEFKLKFCKHRLGSGTEFCYERGSFVSFVVKENSGIRVWDVQIFGQLELAERQSLSERSYFTAVNSFSSKLLKFILYANFNYACDLQQSKEECEYLIELAKPHMVKSSVVDSKTGKSTESRFDFLCVFL